MHRTHCFRWNVGGLHHFWILRNSQQLMKLEIIRIASATIATMAIRPVDAESQKSSWWSLMWPQTPDLFEVNHLFLLENHRIPHHKSHQYHSILTFPTGFSWVCPYLTEAMHSPGVPERMDESMWCSPGFVRSNFFKHHWWLVLVCNLTYVDFSIDFFNSFFSTNFRVNVSLP